MKKLTIKVNVGKRRKGIQTARYATAADPISKTMTCVSTEFFLTVLQFVGSVEELLHEDWDSARFEMLNLRGTPLQPRGEEIFSDQHAALLKAYDELDEQLWKKHDRVRIVGNPPEDIKLINKSSA
jgi:hypothetical protein